MRPVMIGGAAVFAFVLVYLLAAFILWEIDASHWGAANRFIVTLVGAWLAFMAALFANDKTGG